jgi:integrase
MARMLDLEGKTPATINHKLEAGSVALRWAHNHGMIEIDPTVGLRRFSGRVKVRGILTEQEVCRLFSLEWKDRRAYVGNILAATTGLRAGEILALKSVDI